MQSSLNRARLHHSWLLQRARTLLQDYEVVTDKQLTTVSAYTQVKLKDTPKLLKIPKARVFSCLDTSSTTQMAKIMGENGGYRGTSWSKFIRASLGRITMGKTVRASFFRTWMGEHSELGMYVLSSWTRFISVRKMWMTLKWLEEHRIWLQSGRTLMKNVDIDEPTSFLDHVHLGCTQRACKPNQTDIEQYTKMFESRISSGASEKLPGWQKPHAQTVASSYDMAGHAQKCVEWYC